MNLSCRTRKSWAKNREMVTGNRVQKHRVWRMENSGQQQKEPKQFHYYCLLCSNFSRPLFMAVSHFVFCCCPSTKTHVKRYKHGTAFMSIKQVLKPTEPANWILFYMYNAQLCIFQWWKYKKYICIIYSSQLDKLNIDSINLVKQTMQRQEKYA